MAEETKYNSTDADRHFDYITSVMKENENFLLENAGETYDEVVSLINDAIDFIGFSVKGEKSSHSALLKL